MQTRPDLGRFAAVLPAVAILVWGATGPLWAASTAPATVSIESVGVAWGTGWAVMHLSASRPTEVQVTRAHAPERVVADFLDAILAPGAVRAIEATPRLPEVVSLRQTATSPSTVRLELAYSGREPPVVQRFADRQGLLVRLFLGPARSAAPPGAVPRVAEAEPGAGVPEMLRPAPESTPPVAAALRTLTTLWRDLLPRPTAPEATDSSPLTAASMGPLVAANPSGPESASPPAAGLVGTTGSLLSIPPSLVAARPAPAAEGTGSSAADGSPEIEKVRVVSLEPLRVAVDCSRPAPYRIGKLESPPRHVVTFPGASVARTCVRAVALYPARGGAVAVEETDQGASVVIPAAGGEVCSGKPGASPDTVVCELSPGPTGERVAQDSGSEGGETSTGSEATTAGADDTLINVDFQDAAIVEILTALARYADRNIITTPSVTGNMSVHLTEVTLTQALDLIVALNSLEYTLVGERNYVVGTPEEIARIKTEAAGGAGALPLELIYKPQNTTPQRIAQELEPVVQSRGVTIRIVEDAKSMVFMNVPDEQTLEWLREHATQVDVPPIDTTRWIQLEHVTPAQAESALKGLTPNVEVRLPGPEAGRVAVIGLSGKSVDVDEAEQILKTIDAAPPTGPTEPEGPPVTRTVRVCYTDPDAVAQLVTTLLGEQVEAILAGSARESQDVTGTQEAGGLRAGGTIVLRGPEEAVAAAEALIAQIDVPPPQVQISTTITDLNVDKSNTAGFSWRWPGLIISEESTAGDGFNFGRIVRAALNGSGSGAFQAEFQALLKTTNGRILSRTKLVSVNGKSASFLAGTVYPYEIHVAGDGTISNSVEFEEVGLGLKFAPSVDPKGQITLFLSPSVRTFTGFTPQGYPIVATREAKTVVRVADGDIIVIGGLLRDEEIRTLSGVPFLKDIPFFGELFKQRQTTRTRSEIVVFAEVNLIRPEQAAAGGAPTEGEG
jgi:type II secretory pathway component GspD/PulD (secretin)